MAARHGRQATVGADDFEGTGLAVVGGEDHRAISLLRGEGGRDSGDRIHELFPAVHVREALRERGLLVPLHRRCFYPDSLRVGHQRLGRHHGQRERHARGAAEEHECDGGGHAPGRACEEGLGDDGAGREEERVDGAR